MSLIGRRSGAHVEEDFEIFYCKFGTVGVPRSSQHALGQCQLCLLKLSDRLFHSIHAHKPVYKQNKSVKYMYLCIGQFQVNRVQFINNRTYVCTILYVIRFRYKFVTIFFYYVSINIILFLFILSLSTQLKLLASMVPYYFHVYRVQIINIYLYNFSIY